MTNAELMYAICLHGTQRALSSSPVAATSQLSTRPKCSYIYTRPLREKREMDMQSTQIINNNSFSLQIINNIVNGLLSSPSFLFFD